MRYAILLEYDGTAFHGWQIQPAGATIQAALEEAISKIIQQDIRVTGSGRTDAGVHAAGQVAHFDADLPMPVGRLTGAINTHLPDDIRVLDAQEVTGEFNSRFDAIARHYQYNISYFPHPITRHTHWYCKYELNIDLLNQCASMILGEHDFTSFCASVTDTENMVCDIQHSEWEVRNTRIIYRVHGSRFLHHMVRMLVGTMIEVARGRWSIDDFRLRLQQPNHDHDTITAPAKGLILERVVYPTELHLFEGFYGQ